MNKFEIDFDMYQTLNQVRRLSCKKFESIDLLNDSECTSVHLHVHHFCQ